MLDKKLLKKIDDKTKVISHPTTVTETVNIWANGWPKAAYDTWREDCRRMYNDIYWVKIWSDHLKAKAYDILINSSVEQVEQFAEEKEEEIPLIDGGGKKVKKNG